MSMNGDKKDTPPAPEKADPVKPELLAPAGTITAGLIAFDCGADAVYAGLPRFNARERGDNFTADEMSRLIAYAHKINRKVYVTLNTLLKETELTEAADIAAALVDMGPDAVIVQDLGLVHVLRTCFPSLTLHGSTQMGLHNSAGAAFAQTIGLSRIILERQVTFEELSAIRKNTNIELEMFVHGALCCGRSGACMFSSWLGGWSGNRGKCKQPCRRRYFSQKGNGFFFSPGDLCLLENVPLLKKAGLSSLKIEGRLRREDYVRSVVSAYRHMLNAAPGAEATALREARGMLMATPGRKWTAGFTS
ncbi:MAG: peptidase U32 family protein, partial [bacterium]